MAGRGLGWCSAVSWLFASIWLWRTEPSPLGVRNQFYIVKDFRMRIAPSLVSSDQRLNSRRGKGAQSHHNEQPSQTETKPAALRGGGHGQSLHPSLPGLPRAGRQ
jgi:hypothetical protein